MTRPLRRWKSFWFGVLVNAFLGWAWVRAINHYDAVTWTRGPVDFGLSQGIEGVGFYAVELPTSLTPGFRIAGRRGTSQSKSIPRMITWRNDGIPGLIHHRSVHVAHWFLILLFVVPWSGWLVWRQRRFKRGAAAHG
jgi:hypothetical protein